MVVLPIVDFLMRVELARVEVSGPTESRPVLSFHHSILQTFEGRRARGDLRQLFRHWEQQHG